MKEEHFLREFLLGRCRVFSKCSLLHDDDHPFSITDARNNVVHVNYKLFRFSLVVLYTRGDAYSDCMCVCVCPVNLQCNYTVAYLGELGRLLELTNALLQHLSRAYFIILYTLHIFDTFSARVDRISYVSLTCVNRRIFSSNATRCESHMRITIANHAHQLTLGASFKYLIFNTRYM